MIRILGRLYWNFARTFLPAPKDAEPPILIIVDASDKDLFIKAISNYLKKAKP